jgi:hypothetical protein
MAVYTPLRLRQVLPLMYDAYVYWILFFVMKPARYFPIEISDDPLQRKH